MTSAAVRSLSVTEPVTGFTLHTPGDSEHSAEAAAAWTLFELSNTWLDCFLDHLAGVEISSTGETAVLELHEDLPLPDLLGGACRLLCYDVLLAFPPS